MNEKIRLIGKIIGTVSGIGACAAWMLAMWSPTPALHLSGMGFTVALMMAMLAAIVVVASMQGHWVTLIVLFFASFFPIGLFLLGESGWVGVIGILNLGYLFAGLIAWRIPTAVESNM